MRNIVLVTAVLLLLSTASAYVEIYARGFSYHGNYGNLTYIHVKPLDTILETWRAWGFKNIAVGESIDPNADGILVLGCTALSKEDINALENYILKGGRVALDLYCPGPLDDLLSKYGIVRNEGRPYRSTTGITVKTELPYADIMGYPVESEISISNSPTSTGYTGMTYVGPTFTLTNDQIMPLFATPTDGAIAFFGRIGKGYVYGSGCLLCSNQMLMANILDWLSDGRVDFPHVKITRNVHPQSVIAGNPIYDDITITLPKNAGIIGIDLGYVYDEKGFCQLKPAVTSKTENGNIVKITAKFTPEQAMQCKLGPAVITMNWDGPDGEYVRKVVLNPVPIVVSNPYLPVSTTYWPYYVAAVVIAGASLWFFKRRSDVKRKIARLNALKEAMNDLRKQLMTQQITEDVYKSLLQKYLAEYNEIRAELKEKGIDISQIGSGKPQHRTR